MIALTSPEIAIMKKFLRNSKPLDIASKLESMKTLQYMWLAILVHFKYLQVSIEICLLMNVLHEVFIEEFIFLPLRIVAKHLFFNTTMITNVAVKSYIILRNIYC